MECNFIATCCQRAVCRSGFPGRHGDSLRRPDVCGGYVSLEGLTYAPLLDAFRHAARMPYWPARPLQRPGQSNLASRCPLYLGEVSRLSPQVTVYLGPARSGKSSELLRQYADILRSSRLPHGMRTLAGANRPVRRPSAFPACRARHRCLPLARRDDFRGPLPADLKWLAITATADCTSRRARHDAPLRSRSHRGGGA